MYKDKGKIINLKLLKSNRMNQFLSLIKLYIYRKIINVDGRNSLILNINRDLTSINQKRILVSYITKGNFDLTDVKMSTHSNVIHVLQIVKTFIDFGFAIDICHCNDISVVNRIERVNYDIIFGFGKVFDALAKNNSSTLNILFVTENEPSIAQQNYMNRLNYFRQRHKTISTKESIIRNKFYATSQFEKSDIFISINSDFNNRNLEKYNKQIHKIKINGLKNPSFDFDIDYNLNGKSFAWFGSNGLIHKGLDILVDVFSKLPDLTLNVYGLDMSEYKMIKHMLTKNIIVNPRVIVYNDEFICNVVRRNTFVVSLSCSEAMNSGVATCMMHGLIPLVTRESGYDSEPFIFEFPNYDLLSVYNTIISVSSIDTIKLQDIRKQVYTFANNNLSIESFSMNFKNILKVILNDQ